MNRVFNDYDSRIRPDDAHGENGTKVAVTAYIRLISDISTDAMVYLLKNVVLGRSKIISL